MEALYLTMFFKPLAILALLAVLLCARFAVMRWFPAGRLKRFLLLRAIEHRDRRPTPYQHSAQKPAGPRHFWRNR